MDAPANCPSTYSSVLTSWMFMYESADVSTPAHGKGGAAGTRAYE
jgi:hypothetical protein